MSTAIDFIKDFVADSIRVDLSFKALALDATAKKLSVPQTVTEILNHKDADLPAICIWQDKEKGAGKKVGTVKSLSTIAKDFPLYLSHPYLSAAKRYQSCAGHYLQNDKKVLLRKKNGDDWELRLAKKASKAATTSDGTDADKAVLVSLVSTEFQVLVDALRPVLTAETRDALVKYAAALNLDVTIDVAA